MRNGNGARDPLKGDPTRHRARSLRRAALAIVLTGCAVPAALVAATLRQGAEVRLRPIGGDLSAGVARAVVVEKGALVHTALMFPEDASGGILHGRDPRAQAERVLDNLELALKAADTSLEHLVRLHVYVANASVTPHVDALLAERLGSRGRRAAATFVESAMAREGALVAMDAIAATAAAGEPGRAVRLTAPGLPGRTDRASHASIQPQGPFAAISGRAARGEFEPAIRETLEQLRGDLKTVGLGFEHVVQIKSFLGDMSRAAQLERIVAAAFGDDRVPPQVVTEWRQEAVPAEIEMLATAPRSGPGQSGVDLIEPIAGRYSRIAHVHGGRPVFLSGLFGRADDPVAQVNEMFADLNGILQEAGSDIRHLVKATYYVSDRAADDRINAIRPTVYDPGRPPAASKLTVRGTGRPGRASTFDMIAVTTRR